MNSILRTRDLACPEALSVGRASRVAPSLVIFDPACLYAEAIGAVVRKWTHWQVASVTTSVDVALAAARACQARAVLFDVRDFSPGAVLDLVRRIRCASPQAAPVLLTGHKGAGVLHGATAAGVQACVYKGDTASALVEALQAVDEGGTYVSASFGRSASAALLRGRAREIGALQMHELRY